MKTTMKNRIWTGWVIGVGMLVLSGAALAQYYEDIPEEYPAPGCGNPENPTNPCDDCPAADGGGAALCSETPNAFHAFLGNAQRTVRDLEVWGGVGEHALAWERFGHSRLSTGEKWFGHGHVWRHSYQWELVDAGTNKVTVYYPSGRVWTFSFISGAWSSPVGCPDRITKSGSVFTLTRANGWRYRFTQYSGYYQLDSFLDSRGNVYTLTYDPDRRLTQVTEPAGRWLRVNYQQIAVNDQSFTTLATIVSNSCYCWQELSVTDTNRYRYLRYYTGGEGTLDNWNAVAEVEFYDANSNKLSGTTFGTSPAYAVGQEYSKAFDGNTTTAFRYAYTHFGFTGIDLGAGNEASISKVRFFPPGGHPEWVKDGKFQGANVAPVDVTVIASVETSDGRRVTYNYATVADDVLETDWVVLTGATYGDGTQAAYDYVKQWAGQRPLLREANDPRGSGAGTHMLYQYWKQSWVYGAIYVERNGADGTVIAKLQGVGSGGYASKASKITYANGAVHTLHRTGGGVTNKVDGLGRVTRATYGNFGNGFLLTRTDPLGRTTSYTRDTQGRPRTITHPDGSVERWSYNALGGMLTYTNELGRGTKWTYDTSNRVTRVDYPDASYETWTYNGWGQVLTHRGKNGGVEGWSYDGQGLKTSHTDALGNVTTYAYNTNDLVSAVTDARGNTTSYEYDERGRVTKITHPDSSFARMFYDTYGNVTNRVNELGHATRTTYDEFNRVVTQTDALGRTTTYSYAGPGGAGCGCSSTGGNHPTVITAPNGKTTEFTYDQEWQKTSEVTGVGTPDEATTQYQYDAAGNLVATIDPRGHTWSSTYDNRNRKITSSDPLGNTSTFSYDAVGNVVAEIRPDGGVTTNAYDAANRLVWTRDPKNQVTQFAYDAAGNMTSLTDARTNTYSFTYDLENRRTSMVYPDSSHEDYAYNAVGNLARYTTRAGQVRMYTYDNRNREVLADWNDSTPDVVKSYDAAGRLTLLSNSVSVLTYTYDAANQLLSETQTMVGQTPLPVQYTYDLDGNRATVTYPSGTVVTYGYTARNQMATVTADGPPPLATYSYDAAGNRIRKTLENGTAVAYAYDDANRLLTLIHSNATAQLARFDYTLNAVGNRTSKTQSGTTVPVVLSEAYAYDAIDQIIGVDYATNSVVTRSVAYQYDPVGNRQQVVDNSATITYAANNLNQYTVVNGGTLTYDANGNLTGQPGWTYTYDAQNRLIAAGSNSVTIATFAYDAWNRCVARTIHGTTTYLAYDGWSLIEERGATGALQAKYVHGAAIDEILVRYNGAPIYHHHDGLGSVTHLTDATGALIESYTYDVFGAVSVFDSTGSPVTTPPITRFTYTGREWLPDVGLYDYRNRIYSPSLGRFQQTDPLRFDAYDINIYRYAANNPVCFRDPLGELVTGEVCKQVVKTVCKKTASGWACSVLEPSPAGECIMAGVTVIVTAYTIYEIVTVCCDECPKDEAKKKCKPCIPPVGTKAHRIDYPPSPPHANIPTPHTHHFVMMQSPPEKGCICFWHETSKHPTPGVSPFPGEVPITPPAGGGIM